MKDIVENIKWEINWYYCNFILLPIREIKWFIQRGRRGWADCDVWEMGDYIAKIIPEMIDFDGKFGAGYPFGFSSQEEWNKTQQDIASGFRAFQLFREDVWYDENKTSKENQLSAVKMQKEVQKSLEKSCKLLAKHLGNLWD